MTDIPKTAQTAKRHRDWWRHVYMGAFVLPDYLSGH
jgi:hypothetical protein